LESKKRKWRLASLIRSLNINLVREEYYVRVTKGVEGDKELIEAGARSLSLLGSLGHICHIMQYDLFEEVLFTKLNMLGRLITTWSRDFG
jgi:hypothetical protein